MMRQQAYNELMPRGEPEFPLELYHLSKGHVRYVMPCHWHMEYELVWVLTGKLTIWLDGAEYRLKGGDLLWIAGGVLHSGQPEEGCEYQCIVFDMDLLQSACGQWSGHLRDMAAGRLFLLPKPPEVDKTFSFLAEQLFSHGAAGKKGSRLAAFGALCSIFGYMIEKGWYTAGLPGRGYRKKNIRLLKDLFDYIELHYNEPLTLNQLARQVGMSPKYFCRFFREMTRHTPVEYLNLRRISHACSLLSEGSCSVTEAAYACGFNDLSYFIRIFHRSMGITPKQYALRPNEKEEKAGACYAADPALMGGPKVAQISEM